MKRGIWHTSLFDDIQACMSNVMILYCVVILLGECSYEYRMILGRNESNCIELEVGGHLLERSSPSAQGAIVFACAWRHLQDFTFDREIILVSRCQTPILTCYLMTVDQGSSYGVCYQARPRHGRKTFPRFYSHSRWLSLHFDPTTRLLTSM